MSKTKDYIDKMSDAGIDVLAPENFNVEYCEQMYLKSLKDMNAMFSDKFETEVKSDKKEKN